MSRIMVIDRTLKKRVLLALRGTGQPLGIAIGGLLLAMFCTLCGGFAGIGAGLVMYIPLSRIGVYHPILCCEVIGGLLGFAAFIWAAAASALRMLHRRYGARGGGTLLDRTLDKSVSVPTPQHRIEA